MWIKIWHLWLDTLNYKQLYWINNCRCELLQRKSVNGVVASTVVLQWSDECVFCVVGNRFNHLQRSLCSLVLSTLECSSHTPNIREHFTLQVDADLLKTSQMWRSRGGCHMMTRRRLVFVYEWKVSSCSGEADLPTTQIVLTLCRLFYFLFSFFHVCIYSLVISSLTPLTYSPLTVFMPPTLQPQI